MKALLRIFPTLMLVLSAGWMGACAHLAPNGRETTSDNSGNLTTAELEQVRQSLVPHPIPDNPNYVRVRLGCLFFAEHPQDKSMVPVGTLKQNTYLILRRRDGEWYDVQLTSGQHGSVMANNMSNSTEEDRSPTEEDLDRQPDLQPLSLPQASASPASPIDPVLLGG